MKFIIIVFVLIAFSLIFVVSFTHISIGHYSDGERTGLLNKLSKKGVICKTYEGYILVGNGQNVNPETFYFTVKDENLAKSIQEKVGQVVSLQYDQKLFTAKCWGDTSYEITGIKSPNQE